MTLTFAGDDEYQAVTKTTTINITKEASVITAPEKSYASSVEPKSYTATLKSSSDVALYQSKVTLNINGKTYSATVNSKGNAIFKIDSLSEPAVYDAILSYDGSKYFEAANVTTQITVTA